jgi:hypothetical protein
VTDPSEKSWCGCVESAAWLQVFRGETGQLLSTRVSVDGPHATPRGDVIILARLMLPHRSGDLAPTRLNGTTRLGANPVPEIRDPMLFATK